MKKVISAVLALGMVFSISSTAFAATMDASATYKSSDGGSLIITVNGPIDNNDYTVNLEGKIYNQVSGSSIWRQNMHGEKSQLSSDGKVTFSQSQLLEGYTTFNGEAATGLIGSENSDNKLLLTDDNDSYYLVTPEASNSYTEGSICYYQIIKTYTKVSGTDTGATFKSDTGSKLSVNYGEAYQFKITSLNGRKPTFVCGNSSVFQVKDNGQEGSNYYYKVYAVGNPGQSAGFYINGSKVPSTIGTVTGNKTRTFISDTGSTLELDADRAYQFKITSLNNKEPTFMSGNSDVAEVSYKGHKGNDYFYSVCAVGYPDDECGIYINNSKTANTVIKVTGVKYTHLFH